MVVVAVVSVAAVAAVSIVAVSRAVAASIAAALLVVASIALARRGVYRGVARRGIYRGAVAGAVVGRRYYGGVYHGHGRCYWHGRWWPYGVGSCWRITPDGYYVWVCG